MILPKEHVLIFTDKDVADLELQYKRDKHALADKVQPGAAMKVDVPPEELSTHVEAHVMYEIQRYSRLLCEALDSLVLVYYVAPKEGVRYHFRIVRVSAEEVKEGLQKSQQKLQALKAQAADYAAPKKGETIH